MFNLGNCVFWAICNKIFDFIYKFYKKLSIFYYFHSITDLKLKNNDIFMDVVPFKWVASIEAMLCVAANNNWLKADFNILLTYPNILKWTQSRRKKSKFLTIFNKYNMIYI